MNKTTVGNKKVITSDVYFAGQVTSDEETAVSAQNQNEGLRSRVASYVTKDGTSLIDDLNESIPSNMYNRSRATLNDRNRTTYLTENYGLILNRRKKNENMSSTNMHRVNSTYASSSKARANTAIKSNQAGQRLTFYPQNTN